jgi:hypothetical protein
MHDTDDTGSTFERLHLDGRDGSDVRREFGSDDDEWAPEGLVNADSPLRLALEQSLAGGSTWFPDLRNSPEYRVVATLDWSIRIDEMDDLGLKVGIDHEYDPRTDGEASNHDLASHASLVIDL